MLWKSAHLSHVVLEDGRSLIDFTSGVLVANVGHSHPKLAAALQAAASSNLLHCYKNDFDEKREFHNAILKFADESFDDFAYSVTGAEAVECALRMCRRRGRTVGKSKIIAFSGAFHGKTMGAAMLGDIARYKEAYLSDEFLDLVRLPFPSTPATVGRLLEVLSTDGAVGCMFLEVVQGSTLERIDDCALQEIYEVSRKRGIWIVADEIQSGFYRCGRKFMSLCGGLGPDILLLGKGITSSVPMSGLLLGAEASEFHFESLDCSTHIANPLSVAAALACLQIYESKEFQESRMLAEHAFQKHMTSLRAAHFPGVLVISPGGLIGGLEFADVAEMNGTHYARAFCSAARSIGLLVPDPIGKSANIVKFSPPLSISLAALEAAFDIVRKALETATSSGKPRCGQPLKNDSLTEKSK